VRGIATAVCFIEATAYLIVVSLSLAKMLASSVVRQIVVSVLKGFLSLDVSSWIGRSADSTPE
jgi:hypothetical protein